MVPYSKGHSESFRNICGKAGVQIHFKGNNTVKDLLVALMDRDSIFNKGGVIYRYKCDHMGCTMEYIGKAGRNFGHRYKEHLWAPSIIFDHSQTTGHSIMLDNFSIVDRKSQVLPGSSRRPCTSVNNVFLKRQVNLGKYQLPFIRDEVLQDMPALPCTVIPYIHPLYSPPDHLPTKGGIQ